MNNQIQRQSLYYNQRNKRKMKKTTLCFVLFLLIINTMQSCHYTCSECENQEYTSCISCPNNLNLTYSFPKSLNKKAGACSSVISDQNNLLGISLLIMVITACILVMNQSIYYFAFILQTLGLVYFFQIYWIEPLDYILQSFSYLMIFSYFSYPLKDEKQNFLQKTGYKSIFYLKSSSLQENLQIIGILFLVITFLLFAVPIFKFCRRKFVKGQHHCIPDYVLQKLNLALNTSFLFIIQQLSLLFCLTLTFSKQQQKQDYVFLTIYIVILVLYFINICKSPLPFFRNKVSQFIYILVKAVSPAFLILETKIVFITIIYILLLLIIDAIVTNKNQDRGKINKLLFYKFFFLGLLILLMIYYFIQQLKNQQRPTKIVGLISVTSLSIFIYLFVFDFFISLKDKYCDIKYQIQVVSQSQQLRIKKQVEVDNKMKVHVGQQILQNFDTQNASLQNMTISFNLTSQQDALGISNSIEIKSKVRHSRVIEHSIQMNNLSETDFCDIFIPQLQMPKKQEQENPCQQRDA